MRSTLIAIYIRLFLNENNYYTEHFSFGKLLLWTFCGLAGFTFVTIINLRNIERKNPLHGRTGKYKEIILLTLVSSILYFTAPIIFLRDKFDMEKHGADPQFSSQNSKLYDSSTNNIFTFDWKSEMINLPSSYFESLDDKYSCTSFSVWEVFIYNYTFVIFYFLGLNFTHLDKIPVPHLSLTAEHIKKWKWKQYLLIIFGLSVLFSNAITVFVIYYNAGIFFPYLGFIIGTIIFVAIVSIMLRKTHYFHLHHYTWGGFLMMLGGYQNIYITILGALSSGIMIEGISRWGYDKWWGLRNH